MKKINLTGYSWFDNDELYDFIINNIIIKSHKGEDEYGLSKEQLDELGDYENYPDTKYIDKQQWEKFTSSSNFRYWIDWSSIIDEMYNDTDNDYEFVKKLKKDLASGEIKLKEKVEFIDKHDQPISLENHEIESNDSKQKEVCDSFNKRYNK